MSSSLVGGHITLFIGTLFWFKMFSICNYRYLYFVNLDFPNTFNTISLHVSPEPHILLFRRALGTDPQSGLVDPELERSAREEYKNQFGIVRK